MHLPRLIAVTLLAFSMGCGAVEPHAVFPDLSVIDKQSRLGGGVAQLPGQVEVNKNLFFSFKLHNGAVSAHAVKAPIVMKLVLRALPLAPGTADGVWSETRTIETTIPAGESFPVLVSTPVAPRIDPNTGKLVAHSLEVWLTPQGHSKAFLAGTVTYPLE